MSPSGGDGIDFSKPNFIRFNLDLFDDRGVLYLDVDMFFAEKPGSIAGGAGKDVDFAVYNWLNDQHNEAYLPVNGRLEKGNRHSELYRFSHSINFISGEQLICSGGVQYYRNSAAGRRLLGLWLQFIEENPEFADDEGLDYVYNNFMIPQGDIRPGWLGKSYLRFPWWPHVRPIILHPALHPGRERRRIDEIAGKRRFYPERCKRNMTEFVFPADWIIDTRNRLLLRFEDGRLVDEKPIVQDFWIYQEDEGLE